jgi:hypothetical protein
MGRLDPAPPADHPPRRGGRWLVGVAVVAAVAAGAFVLLRDGDEPPSPAASDPVTGPGGPVREVTPSEVADPAEARRLAEHQERRARFESMRAAFEAGQGDTAASRARLEPALLALWPARPPIHRLACRERLCRVETPGAAPGALAALAADPGVRRISEGVYLDPDGVDPAGYVLLATAGALPGDDTLGAVEKAFLGGSDARECLSSVGAIGHVEYELRVDASGFTYRSRTDLPRPVLECVDDVLNGIIHSTEVPRGVKPASRTFALRR